MKLSEFDKKTKYKDLHFFAMYMYFHLQQTIKEWGHNSFLGQYIYIIRRDKQDDNNVIRKQQKTILTL